MKKLLLALLMLVPLGANAQNVSTVTITNGIPTAGSGTVSTLDNLIGTAGASKSNVLSVQGIASGTAVPMSAAALPLPSGAATSANQSTANTSLSSIVTNTTGAATAANQSTGNGSLATIATNSGSPIPDCGATPCTNKLGTIYLQGQFPAGATPIAGNATGTTGAVTATLAGTTGKTTYVCSIEISAIGGTAAVGPITVTGLTGGTATYELASTASGNILPLKFDPCWPASAANTGITTLTTADGSASAVAVNSRGFQQ